MECHTVRSFVVRGQQSDNLMLTALAENMQTPRTILAAAPGKKNSPHRDTRIERTRCGVNDIDAIRRLGSPTERSRRKKPTVMPATLDQCSTTRRRPSGSSHARGGA